MFPEYVADVKSGRIPHYVSPLIENTSANLERANGRLLVRNGRILHLQAVDTPGYGAVATIHGTCVGMLDNCMNELRALGASGTLKLSQSEETLVQSLADTGLKQDVAVAAEISQSKQPTMAQRNAEIIADFEVRAKQIRPDQREARIAELLDSGEDLSSLANYLQGQSLKMRNETMGAAAPKRVLTARDIVEHPKFKELQSTVQDLKKAYGIAEKDTKSTEPVGFELENSISLPYRDRRRILGASGRGSPSKIKCPVGFELEDCMNSGRNSYTPQRRILGAASKPESGLKKTSGFELEDSMWR